MSPTSTLNPTNFGTEMLQYLLVEAPKQAVRMLWHELLIPIVSAHWLAIFILIFVLVVFATLKALGGYWGTLGRVLYNLFYFGTLFLMGLIFGPEIFLNDIFNLACAIILYPVCYWLVGRILRKTGLR